MNYTLGQAAKATGRVKSTILVAIRKGRISATKDDIGNWRIDPAELHRVFPRIGADNSKSNETEPSENTAILVENARLKEAVAGLERLAKELGGERDFLRSELGRITALLPPPAPKTEPPAIRQAGLDWFWWLPTRKQA